jgi:hypothetical protein
VERSSNFLLYYVCTRKHKQDKTRLENTCLFPDLIGKPFCNLIAYLFIAIPPTINNSCMHNLYIWEVEFLFMVTSSWSIHPMLWGINNPIRGSTKSEVAIKRKITKSRKVQATSQVKRGRNTKEYVNMWRPKQRNQLDGGICGIVYHGDTRHPYPSTP